MPLRQLATAGRQAASRSATASRAAVPSAQPLMRQMQALGTAPAARRGMATDAVVDFDPNAPTAMDKMEPPAPGADFNVVIVGAGNINFGMLYVVILLGFE